MEVRDELQVDAWLAPDLGRGRGATWPIRKPTGCLAEFGLARAGLKDFVSSSEAIAYRVILCGQEPYICSGSVRDEKRWTTTPCLFGVAEKREKTRLPDRIFMDNFRQRDKIVTVVAGCSGAAADLRCGL